MRSNKKDDRLFALGHEHLKMCDIVLSSEKTSISKAICWATGGSYSHARLYTHNSLIHATPDGVFTENPQRLRFEDKQSVGIFRMKRMLTDEEATRIQAYAHNQVGKLYSVKDAVSVVLVTQDMLTNRQFCSRLVAQAYRAAGINLVENPDYCSPQDICTSPLLHEVENTLREPSENEIGVAKKVNPIEINRRSLYSWLNKVRLIAKKESFDVGSEQDAHEFVARFPDYSDKICQYVSESGYLENYLQDKINNPHRFSVDLCAYMYANNSALALQQFEHDVKQELSFCIDKLREYQAVNTFPKSSFSDMMKQLYINLVDFSLLKINTFIATCNHVGEYKVAAIFDEQYKQIILEKQRLQQVQD